MDAIETLPGLNEANAELDRLMAADAAEDQTAAVAAGESATQGERAAQSKEAENAQGQEQQTTETLATAEQDKAKAEAERLKAKGGEKPAAEKSAADKAAPEGSKYSKNRERQDRSWTALNAEKDALKKQQESFERERTEFEQQREAAERQFTPEAYDTAAKKFEEDGKFDLAEMAKKKAAELRKNPPKPGERAKAAAARDEATRKEWALKAGVDFPEVAKDNSPLQVRVAQLMQAEPDLKAHPKGIYMAARLASLETAAASVPALKADLAKAEARIKEFEELTAPGGQSAATKPAGEKTFEQKSDEEQFADLTAQAMAQGSLV
jgi:hypothetical protein